MRSTLRCPALTIVFIVACMILLPIPSKAENIHSLLADANQAMKQREYSRSQQLFARITQNYGLRAKIIYGPKFGLVYYKKGLTELKLGNAAKRKGDRVKARKWFDLAKESFRICYESYPNCRGKEKDQ